MDPQIRVRDAFTVVGVSCRASNDDPAAIGRLWGEFFARGGVAQIPDRADDRICSLYTEYEGDHTKPYTVVLGCEVTRVGTLAPGLVAKRVPAAKYAVVDASGPQPESIVAAWRGVWNSSLARTWTGDFDLHLGGGRVEIHVAVR